MGGGLSFQGFGYAIISSVNEGSMMISVESNNLLFFMQLFIFFSIIFSNFFSHSLSFGSILLKVILVGHFLCAPLNKTSSPDKVWLFSLVLASKWLEWWGVPTGKIQVIFLGRSVTLATNWASYCYITNGLFWPWWLLWTLWLMLVGVSSWLAVDSYS